METISCNLCGSNVSIPYIEVKDRFTKELFHVVCCSNCKLIYLNPRPNKEHLQNYYPQQYEPHHVPLTVSGKWHQHRMRQIQLDYVEKYHLHRGTLLDIGCATGEFLAAASERGWLVKGIELVEDAAQIARSTYGFSVVTGEVEMVLTENNTFDVITLWDVFEHLTNPRQVLQQCFTALKPEGKLVIAIPNLDSFDRYLFGKDWVGWEVPRHLYFFSKDTLIHILDDTGFNLLGEECLVGGKGVFQISLASKFQGSSFARLINKISPIILATLWPYRQFAYHLNKGPVITYMAQKRLL